MNVNQKSGQIGKYIYSTKPIGKGSFSKVYKGFDTETDELIAIKIIDKSRLKSEMVQRLYEEISLLPKLTHPHIVEFLDFLQDSNKFFIIFEYCSGGDLSYLLRRGKLEEEVSRDYMVQIVDALRFLKVKNIVHRDLKPQNIMLTGDLKTVKLTDFNFARELYDSDLAKTMCGSPLYMAPEIIEKQEYNSKSDLWSVGIILYEMVYGKCPYWDAINILDLIKKIRERPIRYPQIVSPECIDLLQKLLQNADNRISWTDFFSHTWLQLDDPQFLPEEPENIWESVSMSTLSPTGLPIRKIRPEPTPGKVKLQIIEDYVPLGITPPTHSQSEPINIYRHSRRGSFRESANAKSLSGHLWGYMSGSVEVVKGAFDFLGSMKN